MILMQDYYKSLNKLQRKDALGYLVSGALVNVVEEFDGEFVVYFQIAGQKERIIVKTSEDYLHLNECHCSHCANGNCIHTAAACLCVCWMLKIGLHDLEIVTDEDIADSILMLIQ